MSATAVESDARPDTPTSAYSVLERRATILVVGWLVALAGLAWWLTVRQASSMSDMVSGLGQVGARMPNDMTIPVFLGMWVGMMVAMMFPTVAPMVLTHRMVVRKRGGGRLPTAAFVGGYLVVWSAIGAVPLGAFLAFRNLSAGAAGSRWLPSLAGAVLVVAGAYQFTRWKGVCLRRCRTPFDFIMTHDWGGGSRSAVRAGIHHGLWCLGCCWALMTVLVVVGLMNLAWMAGISLVFLAEKHSKRAGVIARVVGAGLIGLGIAVILSPDLLASVSGTGGHLPAGGIQMPGGMDGMGG